jgi:hypothetical protein
LPCPNCAADASHKLQVARLTNVADLVEKDLVKRAFRQSLRAPECQ